ncbi:MAG: M20 family metallo-hydrolase [Cyclobacteriaceae bacterium]|nr:M20 family metallo-hydrolase [Cyclobacteriaceae bacterium]
MESLYESSVELLKQLIAIPSFSRAEDNTADALVDFFTERGIKPNRMGNNVWVINRHYDKGKPTLLLNSHHDTVKPNPGYTREPFTPATEDGKLFGLGSNDAGGPLVSLIGTFVHFESVKDLPINIVMAATAEEEISGPGGIESIWNSLTPIDYAIVGEPTGMDIAIAEKGLMVLDCISKGRAGHAAREEGDNAIYKAMRDIDWFRTFEFPKVSEMLGKTKLSVTVIQAGQAHNQVPAECKFTVDCRVTDAYALDEVLQVIKENVSCEVKPRSQRLKPSGIEKNHPLVSAGEAIGKKLYGSPTTSDQALIPVPSIKMGPGDSARSHSADEFIYLDEIKNGIKDYIRLIEQMVNI